MYGVFALLGIVYGIALIFITLSVQKVKFSEAQIVCVVLYCGIFCALGAWLADNAAHALKGEPFGSAGISAMGGIVAAILSCYFLGAKMLGGKENARFFLHTALPSITLIHAFGRIGCYFGGCCYGVPSKLNIGVTYPVGSDAAEAYGTGTVLVPTQLIESVFLFALTIVLVFCIKRRRLVFYLYAYGIYRFIAEFWRGDNRGGLPGFISPSQFMSIVFVIAATVILIVEKKRGYGGEVIVPCYLGKPKKNRLKRRYK